jgi:hypothetical protein
VTATTNRTPAGITAWIWVWVHRCQRELSARVHAAGDEHARRHGWTVTESTGRFGFGARSYRDPRFDGRQPQPSPGGISAAETRPTPGQPRIRSSAGTRPTPSEADHEAGE